MIDPRPRRPLPLTIGAVITTGFAGIWLITLSGYAVGAPSATFTIDNEVVPRDQFFARGGGWVLALALVWTAIAVGLWRHQRWARPAMLVSWVLLGATLAAFEAGRTDAFVALATGVVFMLLAAWYLYGNAAVRRYYATLEPPRATPTDLTREASS